MSLGSNASGTYWVVLISFSANDSMDELPILIVQILAVSLFLSFDKRVSVGVSSVLCLTWMFDTDRLGRGEGMCGWV